MDRLIKVLVVEDEPLLRMGIVDHLEDENFVVLEAGNGHQAIALLERSLDVTVVFTDVDMPGGMGGIELANIVRQRWPDIKLAVTSGFRLVGNEELPHGSLFFPKPYDPPAIARALRKLVAKS
ncbi:response regulator [Devosia sp. Leaf64]|jgi:CheY-like chemotaxis protein|uniref:response regulator n=1 Tax=Devosia sp. Leaf64 TaxID=1736229 RepID=UPI00071346E3|nr:response regulator [Devosia sp. Leaf64]KQN76431.1 hypothetical protein ASE94_18985 [Devosia sp. Leaf64]